MRRGQVETQFNWMFILIAGGIILLVAFTFISRQRHAAEVSMAETLARQLDEITTSAGIAKGTAQVFSLPRIETYLTCSEECRCAIEINPAASKGYEDKVLFGPGLIEGDLLIWAQEWDAPFRVMNFVYMTSPENKYYIIREPGNALGAYLEEKLPTRMNVEFRTSMEGVEHPGSDYARVVYVDQEGDCSELDDSFQSEDVSCVVIRHTGDHTFLEKTASRALVFESSTVQGLGDAALLGAIFSEDDVMFSCNMYSALRRLSYVSRIYEDKMNTIDEENEDGYTPELGYPLCPLGYTNVDGIDTIQVLHELSTRADSAAKDTTQLGQLRPILDELERANDALILKSCPEVY